MKNAARSDKSTTLPLDGGGRGGARHDLSEDRLYDVERTQWLNANGYHVPRYRNDDVIADADAVANQIRVAIAFPSPRQTPSGATG